MASKPFTSPARLALVSDPVRDASAPTGAATGLHASRLRADSAFHRSSAVSRERAGDPLGSAAHTVAAEVFETLSPLTRARSALPLYNVATGYLMTGDLAAAADWYQLALSLDPELVIAHQNLAAVYQRQGRWDAAERHRHEAYRRQRVFNEACATAPHRVLVLCTGQEGNIPFEALLPAYRCHRIKYFIDHASPAEDAALPGYDLVFNAVGEPDLASPLTARIARFLDQCGRPALNRPEAVVKTTRDRLPEMLAGLTDVVVAPCLRVSAPIESESSLAAQLATAGVGFPVLARPSATHGGEGVVRHADCASLATALQRATGTHYVSRFIDTRSADGFYRKYRMIFVDRKPYPYHAAISPVWMVHYFSADMLSAPWKIDEERRFLADPAAVLGARAMASLAAIGERLDLDFAGIDFTCLPDGRIMVFEANATMLVHFERPEGALVHKNPTVANIVAAFDRLQTSRLAPARAQNASSVGWPRGPA